MSAALLQCEMEFLVLHRRTHTFSSVDSNDGTGPGVTPRSHFGS